MAGLELRRAEPRPFHDSRVPEQMGGTAPPSAYLEQNGSCMLGAPFTGSLTFSTGSLAHSVVGQLHSKATVPRADQELGWGPHLCFPESQSSLKTVAAVPPASERGQKV